MSSTNWGNYAMETVISRRSATEFSNRSRLDSLFFYGSDQTRRERIR
jgi:hypothetical protein